MGGSLSSTYPPEDVNAMADTIESLRIELAEMTADRDKFVELHEERWNRCHQFIRERDEAIADMKRWQKKATDVLDELDAAEKKLDAIEKQAEALRGALECLWEWATTVACRSEIGDRYIAEAMRVLGKR